MNYTPQQIAELNAAAQKGAKIRAKIRGNFCTAARLLGTAAGKVTNAPRLLDRTGTIRSAYKTAFTHVGDQFDTREQMVAEVTIAALNGEFMSNVEPTDASVVTGLQAVGYRKGQALDIVGDILSAKDEDSSDVMGVVDMSAAVAV